VTPATAVLLEMLDHIDKLKALHRANESPSFGQVELLFDYCDQVRRSLGVPADTRPAAWPIASSRQVERAARHLVELVLAGRST
jgi:hypothetical protein